MKNRLFTALLTLGLLITGCTPKEVYHLNLNSNYQTIDEALPLGNDEKIPVIVLIGQSNASGCSVVQCLEEQANKEDFDRYNAGYNNILINYCLEDHYTDTNGAFKKVDLTCGSTDGFFGPEVGIADYLTKNNKEQKYIILKYCMSGYALYDFWLDSNYKRGDIYNAFVPYLNTYMDYILSRKYDAYIDCFCWMQGESDTAMERAKKYYKSQLSFMKYLRDDFAKYALEDGIRFIDAGISNSPYCEPGYPIVNAAKEKISKLSELNYYFSTIDNGLTTMNEPYMPYSLEPDYGHYDSLDEIKLGNLFGEQILNR